MENTTQNSTLGCIFEINVLEITLVKASKNTVAKYDS
jgi:hypothetical protein